MAGGSHCRTRGMHQCPLKTTKPPRPATSAVRLLITPRSGNTFVSVCAAGPRPMHEAMKDVASGKDSIRSSRITREYRRASIGSPAPAVSSNQFLYGHQHGFQRGKIDYGLIPAIEVARKLFGQESRERSNGDVLSQKNRLSKDPAILFGSGVSRRGLTG